MLNVKLQEAILDTTVMDSNVILSRRWRNLNNRKGLHILPGLTFGIRQKNGSGFCEIMFTVTSVGDFQTFRCKRGGWLTAYRMALETWKESASCEELRAAEIIGTDVEFEDIVYYAINVVPKTHPKVSMKEVQAWLFKQNKMMLPELREV